MYVEMLVNTKRLLSVTLYVFTDVSFSHSRADINYPERTLNRPLL